MSDYVVGSDNFVLFIILIFVSGVVAVYARQRWNRDDINRTTLYVLAGASIESASWALEHAYLLAWEYYKLIAGEESAHVFWDIAWITYIPTLGVYIGAGLMMAPITMRNFGKYWVAASAAIIAVLQIVGILLIAAIKN